MGTGLVRIPHSEEHIGEEKIAKIPEVIYIQAENQSMTTENLIQIATESM